MASGTAAVLARSHKLAGEEAVSPAQLRGEPLILLGSGRASRLQIESAFAEAGVVPLVRVETHTIGSACALAARGLGIALVNAQLTRAYLSDDVAMLPFRPRLSQDYAFVTSTLAEPSRLAQAFLGHARRHFAQSRQDPGDAPVMDQPVAQAVR